MHFAAGGRPESTADRALRIALGTRETLGYPPDPSASPPDLGKGALRSLAEIKSDLAEIKVLVTGGSKFTRWVATIFVGALLVLLAGATWRLGDRVRIVEADSSQPRPDALSKR